MVKLFNNNIQNRFINLIYFFGILIIVVFFSRLIIEANLDLSSGRFQLDMDERISFDGVKKILHPFNLQDFIHQFFDGDYQFYGRIFWNSAALFSYLPEKLYMNTGQIITTRLIQYIFILSSYFIITFGIIRNWNLRIILLLIFLSIPYSPYFFTSPKPEPLQLLFISIFLYYFKKNNAKFSNYWIFLGLALGVKISTLPLIPFYFFISYFKTHERINLINISSCLYKISFPFLIGLSISIPLLAVPTVFIILGIISIKYIVLKLNWSKYKLIFFIVGYSFFTIIYCFESVYKWILYTLLNTKHGADSSDINLIKWIKFFSIEWLAGPIYLNAILILICFVFLIYIFFKFKPNSKSPFYISFSILISGLILNFCIFLFTKRLWGIYLYIGTIIFFIGLILLVDEKNQKRKFNKLRIFENSIQYFVILILSIQIVTVWIPKTIKDLYTLANRTKSTEYKNNLLSYNIMNNYLTKIADKKQQSLNISIDPRLFQHTNSKYIKFKEYFGEVPWSDSNDIIILITKNIKPEDYKKHICSNTNLAGFNSQCFQKISKLPNGSEILLKVNNIKN
jgi:hypothetical protein